MGFWHIYMGIYGGGEAAAAAPLTTRFDLIGTSQKRLNLIGTSQERITVVGSNG